MGNAATPEITDMAAQGAQIDANFAVDKRIAWAFAPHEQSTPNMTVRLESGGLFNGSTVTERAAQNTGTITAPSSNPRIDRIVVDRASGDVSVVTGAESGTPTVPAVPEGKVPVAQLLLAVATTAITNDMITDERVLNALGLGSIAFQNANNVSITGGTINNLSEPLAVADGGTGSTSLEGLIDELELGTMAFQDADNVAITGGDISGITDLAVADGGTGASSAADARANLGAVNIAGDTMTGDLNIFRNYNGETKLYVSNGDSGSGALSGFRFASDAGAMDMRVRSSAGGALAQVYSTVPGGVYWDQNVVSPGGWFFRLGESFTDYLTIKTSGVGIKQSSPTSELDVNGTVKATDLQLTNDLPITEGGTGASTASDARTNLGLGSIATQSAASVSITGGSISGITDLAVTDGGTGASSLSANAVLLGNGASAISTVSGLGTAGQVLTSNGAGNAPTWQAAAFASAFASMQVFTSSGTWTKPSGCSKVIVFVIGGGGGAGGAETDDSPAGSGGGGGGGCAIKSIDVSAVSTVSVTVGAGGGGGGGNGTGGGGGGTSSFGSYCSATGGGGSAGVNQTTSAGGDGGSGSSGDINLVGQDGTDGFPGMGGSGGCSAGLPGGGGAGTRSGNNYGGGGGGHSDGAGGSGAGGVVIILQF